MDVTQLRYFLVTAELEHVTHAARKLAIAQPALSQSIHRLERELGVKLFARQGRNLKLTKEGTYLRARLLPIVAELESTRTGLAEFARMREATVRLCIATASVIAVDALASFAPLNPDIRFEVSQDDALPDNDIIVDTARERDDGKLASDTHVEASFEERICIAVPASSPLLDGEDGTLALADLSDTRFTSLAGSRRFRSICDELCAQRGFTPHVSFESDNLAVVRKMIGLGLGVGFWPEHSWGYVGTDDVRVVPLSEDEFRRRIHLRLTPQGIEKEAARGFFEHLMRHFERVWGEG